MAKWEIMTVNANYIWTFINKEFPSLQIQIIAKGENRAWEQLINLFKNVKLYEGE